jgi:hypothetical protein
MTKVVYNTCYGGFGLSKEAIKRYWEIRDEPKPEHWAVWDERELNRSDPILVQVVEELGEAAGNGFARLAIRELEPGTKYRIDEYDGMESVMTIDDYEWSIA